MTHFQDDVLLPDTTDKTDDVTNGDFLGAIFGTDPNCDTRPMGVSFAGNPHKASKSAWYGSGLQLDNVVLSKDHNNYFSLGSFRADEAGNYRRRNKQFVALHAVMLDDIGTKVARERLELAPSWMLETSPGNYQAGYILDEPIRDTREANRLMNSIIQAGLCDPGASGPTTRLARLPVGVNGKPDPVFRCRLEAWNPKLRYSVEQLISGLSLDMKSTEKLKERKQKQRAPRPDHEDEVFIPRPDENVVIVGLRARGLYKSPLGNGKHDITCPWAAEHTDGVDSGTGYFEPDDNYPIGGFKCFHGHYAHRKIGELLGYLNIEVKTARMKPIIRCFAGEIHRIADKAEQELARVGRFYQRGGIIVKVVTDHSTSETFVKALSLPSITVALSGAASWERLDGRTDDWVRIDPPTGIVSVVHDATDYRHMPPLSGIAHQPYLRTDGTLVRDSGYDTTTGMYGVFDATKFRIPKNPKRKDAEVALSHILELLSEFSFAQNVDKAAGVSAVLTAAIRPSLPLAPMYHVRAPVIGSGKSYFCQIIGMFATARRGAPSSFPHDDEECRKFLLSELLRAPAVIEFDNLTTELLAHKSLCTALTSEFLTDRILGVSKTATVSTRSLFLSSGNNVGPVRDMVRRCIAINLDPACEHPSTRKFKNPQVLENLVENREEYVSAALTIILAWIAEGRLKTECKPVGNYGVWSDYCRQPLLWLGLEDCTQSMVEAMKEDPDREILGRLLHCWHECFGVIPKMVRDVVFAAENGREELKEVVRDIAEERGTINRRILGHWIKRNANRIVDGMRFISDGGSRSAAAWKVESVSSVV